MCYATPEGCREISRWLASETSVTTDDCVADVLKPRPGCQDFCTNQPKGCAASRLTRGYLPSTPPGCTAFQSSSSQLSPRIIAPMPRQLHRILPFFAIVVIAVSPLWLEAQNPGSIVYKVSFPEPEHHW